MHNKFWCETLLSILSAHVSSSILNMRLVQDDKKIICVIKVKILFFHK